MIYAVIDNGQPVAEALGLVHVVRGEQNRSAFLLEAADDVPKLTPALRIESGSRLVKKKDARIADQSGRNSQALLLPTGKLANPGVGFLREFEVFENFGSPTRFAVKTGKKFDGFANVQFFRQARFLQRNADPFPQLARVVIPCMSEDAYFA